VTVEQDLDADFFIPIDRPDLGDGPLMGINVGRCPCAEKRAFYELSSALPVGVTLHPRGEPALARGVDTDRAAISVSTPTARAALPMGVKLHPR